MSFISDNMGPVAPEILAGLTKANEGYAVPYGADAGMDRVRELVRTVFESPKAEVILVASGTAANALALATLCNPWQVIYCHEEAHILYDECNAPQFFTGGAKVMPIAGVDGKIEAKNLEAAYRRINAEGPQEAKCGPLSVTQLSEAGTIYTPAELKTLTDIARSYGQPSHMDGARFANALAALGCSPAELSWKAGIDILSLGGTKNGLMGVEAVILFNPDKAFEFDLRRKRAGHVMSKNRFLAAQIETYLRDDLWLKLARQSNDAATKLEQGLRALQTVQFIHPRQANMLFVSLPRQAHLRAKACETSLFMVPDTDLNEEFEQDYPTTRLVCNWATTDQDIQDLLNLIRG